MEQQNYISQLSRLEHELSVYTHGSYSQSRDVIYRIGFKQLSYMLYISHMT